MIIRISAPIFILFSALTITMVSEAAARPAIDADKDGLSNRQEQKLRTNPRKADTDRDALKDGREVKKTKTNPRKADTDGDGIKDGREANWGLNPRDSDSDDDGTSDFYERKGKITAISYPENSDPLLTVRTKRKTIFQVRVDQQTFLEGLDRNSDEALTLADFQIGDRVEINLDPSDLRRAQAVELKVDDDDDNSWKGAITALNGQEVGVTNRGRVTKTFSVDSETYLRAPDRNRDQQTTIDDLALSDLVEVRFDRQQRRALSLEVKFGEDYRPGEDGYETRPPKEEVEGFLLPGFDSNRLTIARRGYQAVILIDDNTDFFGPDRNGDGSSGPDDLLAGDKIEARLGADQQTALAIEYQGREEEDDGYDDGQEAKIRGFINSTNPLIVQSLNGSVTLLPGAASEYEVMDRNSDGQENLADFRVGDFVAAKFQVSDKQLLELELKNPPPPPGAN